MAMPHLSFMRRFLILVCFTSGFAGNCWARPSWLPEHSFIPDTTISPDGKYGVMVPDAATEVSNKLVDMYTGAVIANVSGVPGWVGNPSMRWRDMDAKWSDDGSTLCWIHPDKWFAASYVVLKLKDGQAAWQVEVMKPADREILLRTEAAAPLNFAIAKLNNADDGSAYPEGFSIDVSEPLNKFLLPLVCKVTLTSNSKASQDEPEVNGVRAWLTMTVGTDGKLTYSDFRVKSGSLSPDAAQKVAENTVNMPLIQTDIGKALLFPGLKTKDERYAIGWTVQPARNRNEEPAVDWSKWDAHDPDKLLRQYNWHCYGYTISSMLPYKVRNFILDTQTSRTVQLPTELPNWPGKRDGWEMTARWYSGVGDRRYGLINNGQESFEVENFWLANLSTTQMKVKELTVPMRNAVNTLLSDRRPEVKIKEFLLSYSLKAGEEEKAQNDLVDIPFVATPASSEQKEFQLEGSVSIRLLDGTVTGASSDQKRLEPFVTNSALKKADETLNMVFQATLKSAAPKETQALRLKERQWIVQRDADASQAVNIISGEATQEACEEAREKSLLDSTKRRIDALVGRN